MTDVHSSFLRRAAIALALTILQVLLIMLVVWGHRRFPGRQSIFPAEEQQVASGNVYRRLCAGDCYWY